MININEIYPSLGTHTKADSVCSEDVKSNFIIEIKPFFKMSKY